MSAASRLAGNLRTYADIYRNVSPMRDDLIAAAAILEGLDTHQSGRVRRGATQAERQAARIVKVGSQHDRILVALSFRTVATAYALARAAGLSPNQCATRLGELRDRGFVEWMRPTVWTEAREYGTDDEGFVLAPTTPGNYGRLHRLTERGREWVRVQG